MCLRTERACKQYNITGLYEYNQCTCRLWNVLIIVYLFGQMDLIVSTLNNSFNNFNYAEKYLCTESGDLQKFFNV